MDLAAYAEPIPEETEPEHPEAERHAPLLTTLGDDGDGGEYAVDGRLLPELASCELRNGDNTENQSEPMTGGLSQEKASPTPPSSQQIREAMKRKWDTALDEIDTNDTYRLTKYRKLEEARAQEARAAADASAKARLTRFQSLPTTPLVSITGSNKRRNTHHDILALIVSVNPELIKRTGMPPKRDVRIMDISIIKKVSLSVFVDAENFHPEPGTVALFKGLTTHEYDGGSLNAYAKDCDNIEWFVPDPPGFENGEVAQLKDCWARLQYSEQVAEQADTLSQIQEPLDIPEDGDIADRLPTVSGKKQLTCFYWAKNGTCRYSDDECAYAHYNTGIVAQDPMHKQNVTVDNDSNEKGLSGLPPSRSLTCFFWARNRKCNRSDEECSYAHYDTGTVAKPPPGVTIFEPSDAKDTRPPTKSLTCYFWNRNGRCNRSDAECAYAHYATGTVAYPPPAVAASIPPNSEPHAPTAVTASTSTIPNNAPNPSPTYPAVASRTSLSTSGSKSLTCFFWARNGHCIRSDAECGYAHYDTGIVANNPSQAFSSEPGQIKLGVPFKSTSTSTSGPMVTRPVSAPTALNAATATSLPSTSTPISAPHAAIPTTTAAASDIPTASTTQPPDATTADRTSFPPVKHLTCYFWANFGRCRRSDEECNYAHFHTGRMAVNPMELRRRR